MVMHAVEHVLGLGMIYHTNKKSGEVLSVLWVVRSTNDELNIPTNCARSCSSRGGIAVAGTLDYLLFQLAPMLIKLAGSFSILALHFGPGLFGLSVITGLAYISVLELSRGKLVALGSEYRQRSDNTSAIKNESISNVELLKYFAMEPYEVTRYSRSLIGSQKADWDWDLYLFTISLLRSAIQLTGESLLLIALRCFAC